MIEAIRMPDLDLFMPGFFDVRVRGGGQEFEQRIKVGHPFFPHRSFMFKMQKCSGVSGGDLAGD